MSDIVRCDGCGREEKRGSTTNWRQSAPFGEVLWRADDKMRLFAHYHFCSWKCAREFAEEQEEMED